MFSNLLFPTLSKTLKEDSVQYPAFSSLLKVVVPTRTESKEPFTGLNPMSCIVPMDDVNLAYILDAPS